MKLTRFIAAAALAASVSVPALAGANHAHHAKHEGMEHPMMCHGSAEAEYEAAMDTMHREMAIAYTGDADIDFAKGMVPHHEGAVAMAKTVLKYGKDPEINLLARRILVAQETEIGEMRRWLFVRGAIPTMQGSTATGTAVAGAMEKQHVKMLEAANAAMHHAMHIDYTGDADVDFARGMIPHHQGAVEMAKAELQFGKSPELVKLSQDVIRSQAQEIALMQRWLERHRNN